MVKDNDFKDIKTDLRGNTLWVLLNRPDQRNAITLEMVDDLKKCLYEAELNRDVSVVVLTGAGRSFCAGGDVKAMKSQTGMFAGDSAELRDRYIRGIQEIPRAIENFRKPIIAFVNGPAIGAGCDLAAMCDLRVASNKANFGETFAKLGLVPGDGGPFFLQRVVGYAKAMEMFLTGEIYSADQALQMRLVNFVFDDDEAITQVQKLCDVISSNGKTALSMTKQALKHAYHGEVESCLEMMAAFQGIVQRTEDHFQRLP